MKKIFVPISRNKYTEIELDKVLICISEGSYTRICFEDETTVLICRLLKELESILCPKDFFRVNLKYLINLNHVKSYSVGKKHMLFFPMNWFCHCPEEEKKILKKSWNLFLFMCET